MIHIYTHSHYAHCLSLNYTFPQIVYINHVKQGDITHCCILWSLRRWGAHYVLNDNGTAAFLPFFHREPGWDLGKPGLLLWTKMLDFGERNLRSF